jgi:hypothetical protein
MNPTARPLAMACLAMLLSQRVSLGPLRAEGSPSDRGLIGSWKFDDAAGDVDPAIAAVKLTRVE